MSSINVSGIADAVMKALDEFKGATLEVVNEAVKKTAKETAKDVKGTAMTEFKSKDHGYAKSWSVKTVTAKGSAKPQAIVYSKAPYYKLAHLLEKPHPTRNGGYYGGREHIAPADAKAEQRMYQYIKEGIEK